MVVAEHGDVFGPFKSAADAHADAVKFDAAWSEGRRGKGLCSAIAASQRTTKT
jgi:hypothetical protein